MLRSNFIALYYNDCCVECGTSIFAIVLIAEETVIKISILIIVTVPSPGNTATAAWRASVTEPGPEMMLDAVSRRKLSRLAPCILYLHPRAFVSYSALSCAAPLIRGGLQWTPDTGQYPAQSNSFVVNIEAGLSLCLCPGPGCWEAEDVSCSRQYWHLLQSSSKHHS